MNISGLWDTLVDAICRPPRDKYQAGDLIGGRKGYCKLSGKTVVREDLVLVNKRGLKLQCSHYKPSGTSAEHALPIVIYCHCNSGSRRDAEEAFYVLLPHNITVFCLDFAGSGMSDGDWVTLGAREVDDLEVAVAHLRASFPNSTIGLWGRSMGAVTALLYSARDPSIAGVVMDSPFARLTELMVELVDEQKLPIPKAFMKVALSMMRRSVRKRAGFDIDTVAPLDTVPQCFIPALFGHATEDTFVAKMHSQRLHDAYAGTDKNLVTFKGDHNSVRPQSFYSSALMFLHVALHCSDNLAFMPVGTAKPEAVCRVMSEKRSAEKEESASETASQIETPTKTDWTSPRQRELAPPWNREQARTNTEHHLQALKGMAHTTSGASGMSAGAAFAGEAGISRHASDDFPASLSSHWLDAEPSLDPPSSIERAPWLAVDPAAAPSRLAETAQRPADTLKQGESGQRASSGEAQEGPRRWSGNGASQHGSQAEEAKPGHTREASCMSVEDRFWHMQPGAGSLVSDEDEETLLARAIEESMRECSRQAQLHSSVATAHAGQETRLDELIPDAMRNISQEEAEELMLMEAIKASLLEAEAGRAAEPSPGTASHQRTASSTQSLDAAEGTKAGRKSRGLFWRRRDSASPASLSRSSSKHLA